MRPLLFVHPPYNFLEDEAVQNVLLAGGVRDLMFGWWQFLDDRSEIDAPALIGPETEGRPTRAYFGTPRHGPLFATIQGCNFRQLSRVTEFIQSKHYLWMGGIDGFKGTLARYAQTLAEWSPALDPKTIERLIGALMGVALPEDYRIADFDRPAPRSFFESIVYRESRKMLQRMGDPEKVSPFVGLVHGGTMLTADELRHLLQAMAHAGLTRFAYYIFNTIDGDVWQVLREPTNAA